MKDLKYYVTSASALMLIYLVIAYNKPKSTDWAQTFKNDDKIPFGTYVLYTRLNDIFPNAMVRSYREPVYNVMIDAGAKQAAYIIICDDARINEYDYYKLIKFIKQGNNVFIAAATYSEYLRKTLHISTGINFYNSRKNAVKFVNKKLDTSRYYQIDKDVSGNYFVNLDTTRATVLGENRADQVNFVKYNFGKGSLYLNANPLLFTNYTILQPGGASYAATALSYVKSTPNIIWDEYYTRGRGGSESLLRFFLTNIELKSALYIAFFGLLIFVIYEMKRRQRIIPIIKPLPNTAMEFANVVGRVYYEQRDNQNIANKKITYFLEYVRSKYYLKTGILNKEFTEALEQKSGADKTLINELLIQINTVRRQTSLTDNDLIKLNNNMEQFYNQAG